jgi:DNA invertase Pin-like site-specific DNA recombinase
MLFSKGCSVADRMLDLGHQHAITCSGEGGFPTSEAAVFSANFLEAASCQKISPKHTPKNRHLGYARVSTYGQTLYAQLAQLRRAGCTKIYREKATTARPDRRALLKLLTSLAPGDVVTVTRIDRLARSTFDLFAIVKLADVEHDLIRTRTAEGRSRAMARGQHMGRPSKLTDAQKAEARKRRAEGATLAELARSYGVGKSTIFRLA